MKHLNTIIILGSLWGIIESTLGHLLHLIPYPIAGPLLFFLALGIMAFAYGITKKRSVIVWISVLAASFKFINLFSTLQLPLVKVIHPALAIIAEGLLFALAMNWFSVKSSKWENIFYGYATPAVSLALFVVAIGAEFIL